MSTSPAETLADLVDRLGGVPLSRIRLEPPPGRATEADVLEAERRENRLFELVDGVLVEKAMGYRESLIAGALLALLRAFVRPRRLGLVSGADGMVRLVTGLVRIPDVAFVAWDRIPGRRVPAAPLPRIVPNLAIEVLSEGNTPAEMERKRREYLTAGVQLVWFVDLEARTVTVHEAGDRSLVVTGAETLDGASVLPGFTVLLPDLFAEIDEVG